jgi:hypothetical protein
MNLGTSPEIGAHDRADDFRIIIGLHLTPRLLRRGGNPAQRGSIVRHRKIENGALGHNTSRIYGAMALVVVSLSVIEIDSHANSKRLKEIARVGPIDWDNRRHAAGCT